VVMLMESSVGNRVMSGHRYLTPLGAAGRGGMKPVDLDDWGRARPTDTDEEATRVCPREKSDRRQLSGGSIQPEWTNSEIFVSDHQDVDERWKHPYSSLGFPRCADRRRKRTRSARGSLRTNGTIFEWPARHCPQVPAIPPSLTRPPESGRRPGILGRNDMATICAPCAQRERPVEQRVSGKRVPRVLRFSRGGMEQVVAPPPGHHRQQRRREMLATPRAGILLTARGHRRRLWYLHHNGNLRRHGGPQSAQARDASRRVAFRAKNTA